MDEVDRSATDCCADMRDKAKDLCNSVEAYVRQEPMKAVVIAAGFGLLAGVLAARR